MGGGVAGEVADVHADGAIEAHEVGHGGIFKDLAGLGAVLAGVGIAIDDLPGGGVTDDAVKGGFVVLVFLGNFELSGGGGVSGLAGGDGAHADEAGAFVEVGFLFVALDDDGRGALDVVAIPKSAGVEGGFFCLSGRGGAEGGEVAASGCTGGGGGGERSAGGEKRGEEGEGAEGFHGEVR